MDKKTFEAADVVVDRIADAISNLLKSTETEKLRTLFLELSKAVGQRYSISLSVQVDVFDRKQERSLPLLQTGMSGFDSDKPYQTWGDSSPQRYIADGEMLVVPHDRCPKCWEIWGFKFDHYSCPHCGATLGQDVKVLLDTDVCPHCEKGTVSMSQPTCSQCGFYVDPSLVVWG